MFAFREEENKHRLACKPLRGFVHEAQSSGLRETPG